MRNQTGLTNTETKPRILQAALELFREKGFEATTMRDIAARAQAATGAAYYYFPSKYAFVLDFYRTAVDDLAPAIDRVLEESHDLHKRLAGVFEVKLEYFRDSRLFMKALAAHVDPEDPVSPFSAETREIRERDIELFRQVVSGSRVKIAKDLEATLPRLLWLYQMGLILYWIHDRSEGQKNTSKLIEKSLWVVVRLIKISGLPLMSPLRRRIVELYSVASE
jgi:AcrR family transcriptional regulator